MESERKILHANIVCIVLFFMVLFRAEDKTTAVVSSVMILLQVLCVLDFYLKKQKNHNENESKNQEVVSRADSKG